MKNLVFLLVMLYMIPAQAEVISWIPPYRIPECKTVMQKEFGTHSIEDGLTHLGLQFWVPDTVIVDGDIASTGNIVFKVDTTYEIPFKPTANDVIWFRDWCHERDIKALLTIAYFPMAFGSTDAQPKNWKVQKSAFMDHRTTFVNALIDTMVAYNLDGIDLDLESWADGAMDSEYRTGYREFVKELSDSLKSSYPEKTLSIASSMDVWGFSNRNCWGDWDDLVDMLIVMAYEKSYEGQSKTSFKYSSIYDDALAAGYDSTSIAIGMASKFNSWGSGGLGSGIINHIDELKEITNGKGSIAIWDLDLINKDSDSTSLWQTDSVWQALSELNSNPTSIMGTSQKSPHTMNITVKNGIIELSKPANTITLYAASGKLLYNKELNRSSSSIVIPKTLAKGVYLLQASTRNIESNVFKITIN